MVRTRWLLGSLILLWLVLAPVLAQKPIDVSFAGTWRITALLPDREQTLALLNLENRGGQWSGRFLAANVAESKKLQLNELLIDGAEMRFDLVTPFITYHVVMHAPKNETRPNRLLGSFEVKGRRDLLRMDKTDARDIDFSKAMTLNPALEELQKVAALPTAKEKELTLKAMIKKYQNWPHYTLPMALELLDLANETKPPEDDVRSRIDQVVRLMSLFGREMEIQGYRLAAQILMGTSEWSALALRQAQTAEKMLTPNDSTASQLRVLKTLRQAMNKANVKDNLADVQARIDLQEELLNQEEASLPIPFEVKPQEPRPAGTQRVVLLEMFNGVHQLPQSVVDPSVAADWLFLALQKTYPATDVIVMQHQLHIPDTNPLACASAEGRAQFYGINFVPAFFVNGVQQPNISGALEDVQADYRQFGQIINKALASPTTMSLHVNVLRDKELIKSQIKLQGIPNPLPSDLQLQLFLVEDRVCYQGSNGQRLHYNVVRALIPVQQPEVKANATQSWEASFDLAALKQQQLDYLEQTAKTDPFPDDDRPVAFRKMKLVACVQNQKTRAVLQATLAEIPDATK